MRHLASILGGLLLLTAFFALGQTEPGITITFHPSWTNSSTGELYGWLGTTFFLLPGAFLISLPLAQRVAPNLSRLSKMWEGEDGAKSIVMLFAVFGTGLFLALNRLVLLGFPITDDEWMIRYGGQILATGRVAEPVPDYLETMPRLFLYMRDGFMTSFDYLGGQIVWALAELTYTDTSIFALFAAAALVGVVVAVMDRLGRGWGVVAGLLFLASPMALLLSMTSHAHVVARGSFAIGLAFWCLDQTEHSVKRSVAMGAAIGFAWITRMPEVMMLWAPFALVMIYEAFKREEHAVRRLAAFSGAFAVFFVLNIAHSYAVTGSIVPARFAPNEFEAITYYGHGALEFLSSGAVFWERFGANTSYNAMMLAIGLLGVPGVVLVGLGWNVSRFTKLLCAGVALAFGLTLLHDNYGLHVVGPIHYSEAAVPLLIVAAHGLERVWRWAGEHDLEEQGTRWLTAAVLTICVGMTVSNVWYARGLGFQAEIHDSVYSLFDDPKFDNSIVFSPPYSMVWGSNPRSRSRGSWVFSWRPMRPGGDERVIIADLRPDKPQVMAELMSEHPDRQVYVVNAVPGADKPEILTLDEQVKRGKTMQGGPSQGYQKKAHPGDAQQSPRRSVSAFTWRHRPCADLVVRGDNRVRRAVGRAVERDA